MAVSLSVGTPADAGVSHEGRTGVDGHSTGNHFTQNVWVSKNLWTIAEKFRCLPTVHALHLQTTTHDVHTEM